MEAQDSPLARPAMKRPMDPFMKTVLLVATAGFLAWAGWLTNSALASGQERVRVQGERESYTAEIKKLNEHLREIRERLRAIETALAVHDVH